MPYRARNSYAQTLLTNVLVSPQLDVMAEWLEELASLSSPPLIARSRWFLPDWVIENSIFVLLTRKNGVCKIAPMARLLA